MTQQEKANEKRLNQAVINNSCTKQAQLKALSNDLKKQLESVDKDGNVTIYTLQKYQQVAKYGLLPKMTSKGVILGYTVGMYNDATDADLKVIGTDGKVKANYAYFERNVKVTVDNDANGTKEESLYTSEEADKKIKGEAGKPIKLYRKCLIGEYGWGPKLLMKVLEQSRDIENEKKRATASAEKWEELKKGDLYIVQNRDGKLVKIKVRVDDANI